MDFWIKAAQLFLSLAILVTLHELGHFLPAKLLKTRGEKFYLFFNPWFSIFRTKKMNGKRVFSWFSKESPKEWAEQPDNTEWGLGWLPLGGYVKIAGMIDESMDKEQLEKPAEPWEFRSKPAWQRLIVMIGGVTVNLILGFLIYIGVVFFWGKEEIKSSELKHGLAVHSYLSKFNIKSGAKILTVDGAELASPNEINRAIFLRNARTLTIQHPNGSKETVTLPEDFGQTLFQEGAMQLFSLRHKSTTIDSIVPGSPAAKSGLKKGDLITAIGNSNVEFFDEIQAGLYSNKNKVTEISVVRNSDTVKVKAKVKEDGTIGFMPKSVGYIDSAAIHHRDYGLVESISVGFTTGIGTLNDYVAQFKFVFTKKGAGQMGGFAAIGNMFPPAWDWHQFWLTTAFLSIILAFMNILPIPALDGGHVVFLIYEMITGKEPNKKVLEYAQYAGMILLLSLVLYANFNDLYRWLFPN
jgi:regulator of sigma E protease